MTREELRRTLARLELAGENIVVHAHLPGLGLGARGDAHALCEVLVEAVGSGTILMPAFTSGTLVAVTSESGTPRPPLAPTPFHADLPADDPVAEVFRHFPGTLRSHHPTHSFLALGPLARELLSTHRDNNPLGPIKKLNLHRGGIVLLGTNLCAAVALHLALESRLPRDLTRRTALRINASGYVERSVIDHYPGCNRGFDKLEPLIDTTQVREVALPTGSARKIPLRYLLHLAHAALEQDPSALFCSEPSCSNCNAARRRMGLQPARLA